MRVSCIAFTERGYALAERTAHALSDCAQTGEDDPGWDVSVSHGFGEGKADLRAWTALAWETSDALLFVGAAGIAVVSSLFGAEDIQAAAQSLARQARQVLFPHPIP